MTRFRDGRPGAGSADDEASAEEGAVRHVYTVSELNLEARALLEENFPRIWVEGEISNLARPRSGHIYFSLKDDRCQLRCAMFRMHNRRIDFTPEDGLQVLANGRISLYPERGDFQLIVQFLEEAGAGALRRAFEALKQRLAAEGLFDEAQKRPLPPLPRQIGVVTSPTGAALRDILSILARRFPAIPVLVYPVPVQGAEAAPEIARLLDVAGERGECDVLILARGGGSLEDLWAFNDESVARAIRRCSVPVVTGIGHEVDVTIADFAADRRAATPSAAAELVSPEAGEWLQQIRAAARRLERHARRRIADERRLLKALAGRLVHPRRRLFDLSQRLDTIIARLAGASRQTNMARRSRLIAADARLRQRDPSRVLQSHRSTWRQLSQRLHHASGRILVDRRSRLAGITRAMEAVSPGATLDRGYAIVTRTEDGKLVRASTQVAVGEEIDTRLSSGRLRSTVKTRD
jgi:exodeoxyribonuclease VII large subunit